MDKDSGESTEEDDVACVGRGESKKRNAGMKLTNRNGKLIPDTR